MQIDVQNEVGRLRAVLVHRPGEEIERMTQHDFDRMLFDDILAATEAAHEHDLLSTLLRAGGASVYELAQLLASALEEAPEEARVELVASTCELAGARSLADELLAWPAQKLAYNLIHGIYWRDVPASCSNLTRIRNELDSPGAMALRPLPNLMFLRDPCISVFDRIVVGRMATPARAREPLLVAFTLAHAPLSHAGLSFFDTTHLDETFHSIEGGDVLVLSPELMLIGCSERTRPQTLERLAYDALFPTHPRLQRVYAVMMPSVRSCMHLDTILTQIDEKLFLGHAPYIAGPTDERGLSVVRLQRDAPPTLVPGANVLDVLREELGQDVDLVACGGDDPLHQEREQWTDGANAIAIAPGQIILYARNTHTVEALRRHGFEEHRFSVTHAPAAWEQAAQLALKSPRCVLTFSGSELSRARGGGRCLTMPLVRDHLHAH